MKKVLIVTLVLALISSFAFAGGGRQATPAAEAVTISVGGSTSVTPLMELFQAEYARLHPNITITVSGTGSGDGITGSASGMYDIGMSSRELRPAEIGTGLDPIVIAIDGIAIIINNGSPIANLSPDQIKDIYTGVITRWEQLGAAANGKSGGIAVISREPGSGTRGAFQEILDFTDANLVGNAIILDGTGAIRSAVAGNPDAIGYISSGSVDNSVKALNVNGSAPTVANIRSGTYQIARPFILIIRRGVAPTPPVRAFLDWVLGPAGQAIVARSWVSVN
ncbi:MAG: phosphate ABC transporter substrate-binding protein [Treponema sp.]|nr:phosphate ABC transporter substrate-binding protein [Treponema sp.]